MSFGGNIDDFVATVNNLVDDIVTIDSVLARNNHQSQNIGIVPNLPDDSVFELTQDYDLLKLIFQKRHVYDADDVSLIQRAFFDAYRHHYYQSRTEKFPHDERFETPFFQHVLWVASALVVLDYSAEQVAAALLHDTLERQNDKEHNVFNIDEKYIKRNFGQHVLDIVKNLSEDQTEYNIPKLDKKKSFHSKMFWSYKDEPEFVPIKMMDRFHNFLSFDVYGKSSRKRIFEETVQKYQPMVRHTDLLLSGFLNDIVSWASSKFDLKKPSTDPKSEFSEFDEYHLLLELQEVSNRKGNRKGWEFIDQGLCEIQDWRNQATQNLTSNRVNRTKSFYERIKIGRDLPWYRLENSQKLEIERQYLKRFFPNIPNQNPDYLINADEEVHRLLIESETEERLSRLIEDYFMIEDPFWHLEEKHLMAIPDRWQPSANFGWERYSRVHESGYENIHFDSPMGIYDTGKRESNERIARIVFSAYDLPEQFGNNLDENVLLYADEFMNTNFGNANPEMIFSKQTPDKGRLRVVNQINAQGEWFANVFVDVPNPPTINLIYKLNPDIDQRSTRDVEFVNLHFQLSPYAAANLASRQKVVDFPCLVIPS